MRSQSSIAYEQLKEQIFHMDLLPGEKISELQISAARPYMTQSGG